MAQPDEPSKPRRRRRRSSAPSHADRTELLRGTYGPDRRKIRSAARSGRDDAAALAERSRERVAARRASLPRIAFPDELPVSARAGEIKAAIERAQVVIVCGETGSGKSTQLPKLCLGLGRGSAGLIAHTQPRRLAARSVAARVGSELGTQLGDIVGCKVRFGDETSENTRIKLMTDGILLAESRSDRTLEQYDTIIIDEAHERSLNIDFLLGILTRLLNKRPELRVIITSATIDAQRFADHFEQALHAAVPIIEVSGRTYPVEIRYEPQTDGQGRPLDLPDAIAEAAEQLAVMDGFGPAGDVLVFLPGEREIRDAARALRLRSEQSRLLAGAEIVPLYARLSVADQQRVFKRSPRRRIVLATNVAETSLTVPGIRYVIDSGLVRINRYSTRRRVQSLQIEPVSRASARQRAGRCGRTQDGVCIRLYAEADHDARPEFTQPEIQRTNLAGVILQMTHLGLGDPHGFPFVEPPDRRRITEAYETLRELAAVDDGNQITPIGKQLARLPVDPRIGRILLEAADQKALAEALIVAAFLECQDPRLRPPDKRDAADAKHARFADQTSDFVTVLNLWDHFHEQKQSLSRSKLRATLEKDFLSSVRLREWTDTHRQLRDIIGGLGIRPGKRQDNRDALHRAVLAGFATSVGRKESDGTYASPLAGRFVLHPGSSVKAKSAAWVVAAELVRTTRLYARMCAKVEPAWVESAAEHLIRREYGEPEYDAKRGVVEAPAAVMLGQLELARGRLVPYASVDRAAARRVFIEQALVAGELKTGAAFERHNASVLESLAADEAKLRRIRRPTTDTLVAFFRDRLPEDVCTAKGFDRFRRRAERENPEVLRMRREDLTPPGSVEPDPRQLPDTIELERAGSAPMTYRFAPGEPRDGIEARLELPVAANADPHRFDWLVPAWLPEKVAAVLAGLPKSLRRQFETESLAAQIVQELRFAEGDFYAAVAETASRLTGLEITAQSCRRVDLPLYLRMAVRVDLPGGDSLAGRDSESVLGAARRAWSDQLAREQEFRHHRTWPADEPIIAPPRALLDAVDGVRVITCPDEETALVAHWFGCRRLTGLALEREVGTLLGHAPGTDRLAVLYQTVPGAPGLASELAAFLPEANRFAGPPACRDESELASIIDATRSNMADCVNTAVGLFAETLSQRQEVIVRLDSKTGGAPAVQDMRFQASQLLHAATLRTIRWNAFVRLPAYFRGILIRLERLRNAGAARDTEAMRQILPHWQRCLQQAKRDEELGRQSPALTEYRWAIEEYRLALFAPTLAVRGAASAKRLDALAEAASR